jgi:tetratricopeptide (TPR) repeat protein
MTASEQRQSSWIPLVAIVAVALVVSASSFGVSRFLLATDREVGAAIADSLERERSSVNAASERRRSIEDLLEKVEQQLTSKPLDSMLVRSAGNLAYDLGRFADAARYYRTFLDNIDGTATEVRIDLGYAVFETGEPKDGMAIIESVIRDNPTNQVALYNLGIMHLRMNNTDEGRRWLEKCFRIDSASDAGKRAAAIVESLSTAS